MFKTRQLKRGFFVSSMHIIIFLYLVYLLFPLLWMVSTSLKPTPEIYSGVPSLIPKVLTLDHYFTVLEEERLLQSIFNSFYVGCITSLIVVFISLPAAYALSRYKTAVNKAVMGWILTSQIFPAILIMIPLYMILRSLHLTDTLSGLILVYVVWDIPFVLWMLQGYVKDIPLELEEAAAIDGANQRQIIYKVIMPLLLPAIGASVMFAFITAWNEFFFALVLLKSPDITTLPVELARYTGIEGQARTGPLAAASFLATIPSILLFTVLRKWFSSGALQGAVKG
ncbi:MAG: carbohydrate ABC transporter permease [Candidatus Marinimicrobia bacterium]|nr:carbohydrate ABC transporter permease [Candidatus Neomarinimicrobiota bacterium]